MVLISDLYELERKTKETLEYIQGLISHHPDYITGQFLYYAKHHSRLAELAKRVTYIEEISGATDSRKNQMEYNGWTFEFDGVMYYYTYGDNWCSSFDYLRKVENSYASEVGDGGCVDVETFLMYENENDLDGYLKYTEEDDVTDVEVIATLLRVTNY